MTEDCESGFQAGKWDCWMGQSPGVITPRVTRLVAGNVDEWDRGHKDGYRHASQPDQV